MVVENGRRNAEMLAMRWSAERFKEIGPRCVSVVCSVEQQQWRRTSVPELQSWKRTAMCFHLRTESRTISGAGVVVLAELVLERRVEDRGGGGEERQHGHNREREPYRGRDTTEVQAAFTTPPCLCLLHLSRPTLHFNWECK